MAKLSLQLRSKGRNRNRRRTRIGAKCESIQCKQNSTLASGFGECAEHFKMSGDGHGRHDLVLFHI